MPHYDKRSGDIIVRVVYDGAPEAGKTTNIFTLKESLALTRRGRLASPGTTSRRTEFFDWLDFQGGYVGGKRVRCQLVSVPGQSTLLRRRRYLLETADSVVFVADAHRLLVAENRETFAQLRAALERARQGVPVGVILQANKQDRPDSLAAADLAERMGLDPTIPRFDAQATVGKGVKETFLLAVRLAVERVKALALHDRIDDATAGFESPELLHELMLERESSASAQEDDEPVPVEGPDDELDDRPTLVAPAQRDESGAVPATAEVPPDEDEPAVEEGESSPPAPWVAPSRLPTAAEIPAGCSWPPVTGRAVVATLESAAVTVGDSLQPWAPTGSHELRVGGSLAHTHPDWAFANLEEARRELVLAVRRCLDRVERVRIPKARTLFVAPLAPDDPRYILWIVTPGLPTLRERLERAIDDDDPRALATVLLDIAILLPEAREEEWVLPHVARDDRQLVVLSIAGTEPTEPPAEAGAAFDERLRELGVGETTDLVSRALVIARSEAGSADRRDRLEWLRAEVVST